MKNKIVFPKNKLYDPDNKYGFATKAIRRVCRTLQQLHTQLHLKRYEISSPPSYSLPEHQKYSVTARQIYNAPRQPGVSGYWRLYNEEDFLEASVLSHLPFLDEIILLHDSTTTDKTPEIAQKLAHEHPDKIKYFFYQPEVFKLHTKEYKILPPTHPNSFVNYYNFALSKTTRHIISKIDGDHIAIPEAFVNILNNIRSMDFMQNTFYTYAGLNLWYCDGVLYVDPTNISGLGDIGFHRMRLERNYYTKGLKTEDGHFSKKNRQLKCAGILYFHLKNMRGAISKHSWRGASDEIHQQRFKQRLLSVQPHLVDWHTFVEQYRDKFLQKTLSDIRTLPDPNMSLKGLLEKIPSIDTKWLLAG